MKKVLLISLAVFGMAMTSCNGGNDETNSTTEQLQGQLNEQQALTDSLLVLFNDITDGMTQIKDLEQIITTPTDLSAESQSRKDQIKNDMIAIQKTLQERRERLAQLEKQLASMSGEKKQLLRTIENLKTQIATQQDEIKSLTSQLAMANIQIEELGSQVSTLNNAVDSLNTGLANETSARKEAESENARLDAEVNAVYYAIGTSKELKDHKIIETGFLRKTKIMKGDFDESYFTTADRRNLTSINTHAKKAEIMTGQPKDTYTIVDENGQKVIKITNPARFWQTTNFLVIKVD